MIVDASVATTFFNNEDPRYPRVRMAVRQGRCCLYYGGLLRREYERIRSIMRTLLALDAAGRAKAVPDMMVDELTEHLDRSGVCQSDDPHIIALAKITGSRLLCTDDHPLQQDFTNRSLLNNPRGKILKDDTHCHLLPRRRQ